MNLSSVLCGSLDRRGVWGRMNTCVCMAELFCLSLEIITAMLTGYAPIQNKKSNLKKRDYRFFKKIKQPVNHSKSQTTCTSSGNIHSY